MSSFHFISFFELQIKGKQKYTFKQEKSKLFYTFWFLHLIFSLCAEMNSNLQLRQNSPVNTGDFGSLELKVLIVGGFIILISIIYKNTQAKQLTWVY